MRVQFFQVDAFTDAVFSGNPAGVCPLDAWLDEKTMLAIAAENNVSETAFFVREGDAYGLPGSVRSPKCGCAATRRWPRHSSSSMSCGRKLLRFSFAPAAGSCVWSEMENILRWTFLRFLQRRALLQRNSAQVSIPGRS